MQRTYNSAKQKDSTFYNCPVRSCNRKYKREQKLINHVEKDHPYDTKLPSKNLKFDFDVKSKIYKLAANYVSVIYKINNANNTIIDNNISESINNLLPQKSTPNLDESEFKRILSIQKNFAGRIIECDLFNTCDWVKVMEDFECFINMGLPYYDTNFNPTLPIDFLWHSAMQDPEFYRQLCGNKLIPHCDKERSPELDKSRYEYFLKVFKYRFGRLPFVPDGNKYIFDNGKMIKTNPSDINRSENEIKDLFMELSNAQIELKDNELEKNRIEQERRKKYDKLQKKKFEEFFMETGIEVDAFNYPSAEDGYYRKGLKGEELKNYIEAQMKRYNSYDSTC